MSDLADLLTTELSSAHVEMRKPFSSRYSIETEEASAALLHRIKPTLIWTEPDVIRTDGAGSTSSQSNT